MSGFLHGWALFALDCLERVEIPKHIVIRNLRLGILLRFLHLCVLALIATLVWTSEGFYTFVRPTRSGLTFAWDGTSTDASSRQVSADFRTEFCVSPERYDYAYDSQFTYFGYRCLKLSATENYWKEADNMLFVPFSFSETSVVRVAAPGVAKHLSPCSTLLRNCSGGWRQVADPYGGSRTSCECSTSFNYFVPGVSSTVIRFNHMYELHRPGSTFLGAHWSAQSSDRRCGEEGTHYRCEETNGAPLRTIIVVEHLDGREVPLHTFLAPEVPQLILEEILEELGLSLDGYTPTHPNLLRVACLDQTDVGFPCRDDVQELPLLRQTGMALLVHLEYVNARLYSNLFPGESCEDCGPVCKVQVSVRQQWEGRPRVSCEGDLCRRRYYYGLRVTFTSSGVFAYVDLNAILITVGSAMTYMVLPLLIVSWITIYFLGPISNIYHNAVKQELSVPHELAAFVMRKISTVATFKELAGEAGGVITKDAMLEEIIAAFSGRPDLSLEEQVELTETILERFDLDRSNDIRLNEFVQGFEQVDTVAVEDVAKLFHRDRRRGPFEYMFNPKLKTSRRVFKRDKAGMALIEQIVERVKKKTNTYFEGIARKRIRGGATKMEKQAEPPAEAAITVNPDRKDASGIGSPSRDVWEISVTEPRPETMDGTVMDCTCEMDGNGMDRSSPIRDSERWMALHRTERGSAHHRATSAKPLVLGALRL